MLRDINIPKKIANIIPIIATKIMVVAAVLAIFAFCSILSFALSEL